MLDKLQCIFFAQIALLNIIEQNKSIDPFTLYEEMCRLFNI